MRFKLLDNDIYSNTGVGISIGEDARPLVESNRIYGKHTAGVYVAGSAARGTVKNNEIYDNCDGIVVREGGAPTVVENQVSERFA